MKAKGYSFKCENFFYMYFKKHYCPVCNENLLRKKVSEIVNSDSPEAREYDFEIAGIVVKGNVKFTHIELYCPSCGRYYSVKEAKKGKF